MPFMQINIFFRLNNKLFILFTIFPKVVPGSLEEYKKDAYALKSLSCVCDTEPNQHTKIVINNQKAPKEIRQL